MIITLKGANFTNSNIGTLNSWFVTYNLTGAEKQSGPISVDKDTNTGMTATIKVYDNYDFQSASAVYNGKTVTYAANNGIVTINITEKITTAVTITVLAASTGGGGGGGEPETPDTPNSWNITFTKFTTIADASGEVISGSRGVSEIIPTDNSMKVVVTSCNYIIYAYSDTSATKALGFVANDMSAIGTTVVSALRWHTAGTTRTLIELLALNTNIKAIRLMTYDNVDNPTYSVTSNLADSSNNGTSSGGGSAATGWEIGTIAGATGQPSDNSGRVRTPDYITVAGKTSVSVSNVDFLIACYASDNTYLGKYLDGVVNTAVEWIKAGTVVKISDILAANSNVAKIKLVGYATNANSPIIV